MSIRVKNNFNTAKVRSKVRSAIGVYADNAAKKMEAEAKREANWQDRTSNARNTIQGGSGWRGNKALISLSGNVDYFVFLEFTHEKRFAILLPTIHKNAADILRGYQKLVK